MNKQFFIPISKRDDEEKMVYGFASTPDLDSQGEVVTVEALEKALPEYMRFPTIREMHQPVAVGTTKEATIDRQKGMYIGAKVVDKDAWEKVKEGVYRGFSIGGRIVEKIGKDITDIVLTEISLVDSPANKSAVITLFKAEEPMKPQPPKKLAEVMKSVDVAQSDADVEEIMHEDIMDASSILRVACELAYTRWSYEYAGKPTSQLDAAIASLKALAIAILTDSEYSKFNDVMDTVGMADGMEMKHLYNFVKVQGGNLS